MKTGHKRVLPGEVALIAALVLNAFAVTMIIKAGLGISVLSGVPYVLSLALPVMSMGAWNTCVQCLWLLVLAICLRRLRPGYAISFLLALVFGRILDFWAWALAPLPMELAFRIAWFACGYVAMAFGIACFMRCGLPVLPFDTVPRELVLIRGWKVRAARTGFDLVNLVIMLAVGLIFLGRPEGIGVGTVFNALLMGTGAGYAVGLLDRFFVVRPRLGWLARMM